MLSPWFGSARRVRRTKASGSGPFRRPPRGVKKDDCARRNFYDTWLPELAPSVPLVSWALSEAWTDLRWETYAEAVTERKCGNRQRGA